MKKKSLSVLLLLFVVSIIFSCKKDSSQSKADKTAISPAVISQIQKLGFSTDNVKAIDGGYIVEGDIFLTTESLNDASRVGKANLMIATTEQYRTQNLVTGLPRTITVAVDAGLSQNFYDATDLALSRWNALALGITFQRVSSGGTLHISLVNLGPPDANGNIILGHSSNFPSSSGNPSGTITLNNQYYNSFSDMPSMASVIQHELGHSVGLRHTDYYNRSISSGAPVPAYEGMNDDNGNYVGAVLIPGTPGKATNAANSFMLAFNNVGNRTFNSDDIIALNYLYKNGTLYPNPFYRFYNHQIGYHFYTMDYSEIGSTIGNFNDEGSLGKIYAAPFTGSTPLYRFYNGKDHLYQTTYQSISGYTFEGVAGYVWTSQIANSIPVYRFYRGNSGHFYTTSYSEGANAGFNYEGVAFYVLNN